MLRDITYRTVLSSWFNIHKLDPRVKIIITFVYIISLFICKNFVGYVIYIAYF